MYACSKKDKNEQPASVSESYQSSGPLLIDKLAIYSWDRQQSDPAYIQGFLDRNFSGQRIKDLFYVNRPSINDHGIGKELRFLKDGMAELNGVKMEIVSKTDTLMLLAELDSTHLPVPTDSDCWRLQQQVPVYNAAGSCPSGSCIRYRKTYPVIIANGDYYLPTLYFAVTHVMTDGVVYYPPEPECWLISQEYPMINFMRADEHIFKEIGFRDTLLVQVGRLKMVKK
jgi:hypothetical protein